MTKVLASFALQKNLDGDEKLLESISRAHRVYGILRVQLSPTLDRVTVEYDASRLKLPEVENVLHQAGVPIVPNTGTHGVRA
jgi:hypothetical protein